MIFFSSSVYFSSKGTGDIYIKAERGMIVSEIYELEDCIYYNSSEVSRTTTNGSTIYDSNMSITLPSKCEVSFDFWYYTTLANGDLRFFLLPKTQFSTGTTQPQYALYVDGHDNNKASVGKRENNSTIGFVTKFSCTHQTYHTIKWKIDGTSVEIYVDDTLQSTQTISWIGNYLDYCFSMTRWSASGTSTMKNAKIKAL